MLTINVKTKAVSGWNRRKPMARNRFGDATPGYVRGHIKPNYPMPITTDWAMSMELIDHLLLLNVINVDEDD